MDVVYECGPNCSCGPECVNRTSQNGLQYRLEVVDFLPWKLIRILSKSKVCPHCIRHHSSFCQTHHSDNWCCGELCRSSKQQTRVGGSDHGITSLQEPPFVNMLEP